MAASSLFSSRPKRLTTPLLLGAPDVTNGLAAWYNGFGNAARDLSGNNRDGTLSNVAFAPGPFGNAYKFDGTATSKVTLPASVNSNIFTVAFRLYPINMAANRCVAAVSNAEIYLLGGGNITVYVAGGQFTWTGATIGAGIWANLALSYNSITGAWVWYLNGVAKASGTLVKTLTLSGASYIGTYLGDPAILGLVADFRIYNRVLAPAEISQIYNSALIPTLDGNLIAFNSSSADAATIGATETPDSAAFSGTEIDAATFAATETADGAAFAGSETDAATMAATEAADVASFAGSETDAATLGATETPDSAAFSGAVGSVDTATLAATETPDAAMFSGSLSGGAPGRVIATAAYRNSTVTLAAVRNSAVTLAAVRNSAVTLAAVRNSAVTLPALHNTTVVLSGFIGQKAAS